MRPTSKMALEDCRATLDRRRDQVLAVFKLFAVPLTARDVLRRLNLENGAHVQDMNYVRPRITELTDDRLIRCVGKPCRDSVTGMRVSAWEYIPQVGQMEMI